MYRDGTNEFLLEENYFQNEWFFSRYVEKKVKIIDCVILTLTN